MVTCITRLTTGVNAMKNLKKQLYNYTWGSTWGNIGRGIERANRSNAFNNILCKVTDDIYETVLVPVKRDVQERYEKS